MHTFTKLCCSVIYYVCQKIFFCNVLIVYDEVFITFKVKSVVCGLNTFLHICSSDVHFKNGKKKLVDDIKLCLSIMFYTDTPSRVL